MPLLLAHRQEADGVHAHHVRCGVLHVCVGGVRSSAIPMTM